MFILFFRLIIHPFYYYGLSILLFYYNLFVHLSIHLLIFIINTKCCLQIADKEVLQYIKG